MVYRKFTKDFNSLGFRLGIAVEVGNDNPNDVWAQGRLLLENKIIAEEIIIEKKFELLKKQKERDGAVKLMEVPIEYEKESLYKEVKGVKEVKVREIAYLAVDFDDAFSRIEFETGITRKAIQQMIIDKIRELRGIISERGALEIIGKELGVKLKIAK